MDFKKRESYYSFVMQALKDSGGSATNDELLDRIITLAGLTDKQTAVLHTDGRRTAVEYAIAWAKTYLKKNGYIDISARGVWEITAKGRKEALPDAAKISRTVREQYKKRDANDGESILDIVLGSKEIEWEEVLIKKLQEISPEGFERLCQRILREKGFTKVEVTGKSGDGGIDGIGTMRLSLLSFRVLFQCKRYKGSVPAKEIRDFGRAMQGRADKGIFLTTGSFTTEAKKEATRDGADPIELIDGTDICGLMKELGMGVKVKEVIEVIEVEDDWFEEYM